MSKKKILLCGEATYANSGYSNYGYQLMSRLYDKGEFDLAELSCFGSMEKSKLIPWKSYLVPPTNRNKFGSETFDDILIDFKPDIVWSFRDPWIDDFIGYSPLKRHFDWLYMPTIDSIPLASEWIYAIKKADHVSTYTEWAGKYLCDNYSDINFVGELSPGAGNELFPVQDKDKFKEDNGINKDCIIIGSVMRNQKRKLIPDLFDAFEQLLNESDPSLKKRLFLLLHTTYPDVGWDIPRLISERPALSKKLLFTYKCYYCNNVIITNFCGALAKCEHCNSFSCSFPKVTDGIKKEKMFMVYNLMDLYVQYSCAEGFGMPLAEAASCGVPVCATNYGAMADIVEKLQGYPINIQRMCYEVETQRKFAFPDNSSFVKICKEFLSLPKQVRNAKGMMTKDLCRDNFNYEKTFEKLHSVFSSVNPKRSWDSEKEFFNLPKFNESLPDDVFINELISPLKFLNQEEFQSKMLKMLNFGFKNKKEIYNEVKKMCDNYNLYERKR